MINFRQRLLATTLMVGAGLLAAPAAAQDAGTASPPDNSATPTIPETTTPVEGQTAVSTSAEGEPIDQAQDIVVTGSRIPQPNLTSSSPVTVVTAQEIKLQGTTRTEDLINSLPQTFAAQGSNISNGATGTATVNLRGLGSTRTLVLINGRRLMPGDPRSPVADLNFVPSALVQRVDVLTGGASSVYGADAVAGVVNFIMDRNFRGLRLDAQASGFMHNNRDNGSITAANSARGFTPPTSTVFDGGAQDLALAFGAGFNDNRGNILGYATYRTQDAVLQGRRDYSFCALNALSAANVASLGRDFSCGGSATSAVGTFFTNEATLQVGPNRTFIPGSTPFNFGPLNYYQRPNERYTLGFFADYEVSEAAKPYLEAMFMDSQTVAQIAPSGNFFNTSTINCDNPLLSAQQRAIACEAAAYDPRDATVTDGEFFSDFGNLVGQEPIFGADPDGAGPQEAPLLGFTSPTGFTDANGNVFNRGNLFIGRRNVEGGPRQDDLQHQAYRIVGGVRGDLLSGLSYDVSYQFGKTTLAQTYLNDFSVTRLNRALDVVTGPNGTPVCRSTLDGTDPNCVPYDVFALNSVSTAALDYLQTPGFSRGNVRQLIGSANFTVSGAEYGLQLPWAQNGVGINVGAEYRKESLEFETDQAFSTGDLAGQGGATIGVSGEFDVRELFGEVQLPIVEDSFFHELSVNAGYRYSDYKVDDNSFSTNTYKVGVEFAPVRDARLRASYNRSVRAPNIVELFAAQSVGLAGSTDPCAGTASGGLVNGFTAAQCALTGVTAAQFGNIRANPANQYNGFLGGNPNLEPETADSYTVGLVLQPSFVRGLALTIDAFDIRVRDTIGTIGADTIINTCLRTSDPFFCSRIQRDAQGSLFLTPSGFIRDLNDNVGRLRTRGVDLGASYARQIGSLGSLNLSLVGTYLDKLVVEPFEGISYDCVGFFGTTCGTPNPEWRHKFRVGFTLPSGIGLSGQWRYFAGVDVDALSDDEDLAQPATSAALFPANQRIDAQSFFDLTLTARIDRRFNFRIGANNILDRSPPVIGSQVGTPVFANGNTFPQVYDALGRYLFAGVTVDF